MYSRYGDRPEKNMNIPENYSGYAFAAPPRREVPPRQIDVAKPTPAPPKEIPEEPAPTTPSANASKTPQEARESAGVLQPTEDEKPPQKHSLAVSAGASAEPARKHTLFGRGIDFDELLLIGLILLLRESDQGSDTLLWLALLLFMG